ncbi:hypothetical protein BWD42_02950 [Sphingobacterium sp. CZ-UAM]|jgi:hypothetical protein|uniref:hypothetical protein n=1 Tax=unclassified Sphingobacterium TaxID=2609468 RepID=UPI0009843853|nr:hypothetical protein [Sphingobacterium sp. CZ-UAM]OOG18935.1 hypothetical protein BWD42_02950 [Sphingobacterium sp. CZ-UAM]
MKIKFRTLSIAFGIAAIGMTASCSKDNSLAPNVEEQSFSKRAATPSTTIGGTVNFTATGTKGYLKTLATGTYGARNFHQGTVPDLVDTTQWKNPASTYYYDLVNNDGGTSAGYDFQFSGTANASLTVNTTKYNLYYVNTAFDAVTAATTGTLISTGTAGSNSINGTGNPSSAGWYIYNISNHIMSSYGPRTYILVNKTTNTKWKLRLNSVYKDEVPNAPYAATNFPFMSFDYKKLN